MPSVENPQARATCHARTERQLPQLRRRRGWPHRRWLQNHSPQLAHRLHQLRSQRPHAFDLLHLRMQRRGRSRIPDSPKPLRARSRSTTSLLSPRVARKSSHRRSLFGIALVGAALVAGRQAHLHLRVHASRMARIGIEIVGAAPQQKQLQRLFGKPLRRRPRSKRPIGPVGLALAGPVASPQCADTDCRRDSARMPARADASAPGPSRRTSLPEAKTATSSDSNSEPVSRHAIRRTRPASCSRRGCFAEGCSSRSSRPRRFGVRPM